MEKILSNPLFFSVVVAALVSAVVTFLLNIFLERYKFKNQYRQMYANRRFQAYEELSTSLSKNFLLYNMINDALTKKEQGTKLSDFEKELLEDSVKDFKTDTEQALKCRPYITDELADEITKFLVALEPKKTSQNAEVTNNSSTIRNITEQYAIINQKIHNEMKTNPYDFKLFHIFKKTWLS